MHGQSARILIQGDSAQHSWKVRPGGQSAPLAFVGRLADKLRLLLVTVCLLLMVSGCGKTVRNSATEQLLLSDSVDKAIRSIDFSPLAGRVCFLDTTYISSNKTTGFMNTEYVVSSVRNQLASAGGVLVDSSKSADIIVEPRLGALGANEHEVTYGIPSNNILSQAAAVMPAAPPVPAIPELSVARKNDQMAATKLAVFAYEAKSGQPIWQSGVSTARSSTRDTWLLGIGPFQSGSIYEKTRFAGARIRMPLMGEKSRNDRRQAISLDEEFVFAQPVPAMPDAVEIPLTATSKSNTEETVTTQK